MTAPIGGVASRDSKEHRSPLRTSKRSEQHPTATSRPALRARLGGPYIGVLGPRARYRQLLSRFRSGGDEPDPASLARVRSPIGLAVGAETAEEIALSILGRDRRDLARVRRRFLNAREASLHRPVESRALARS